MTIGKGKRPASPKAGLHGSSTRPSNIARHASDGGRNLRPRLEY